MDIRLPYGKSYKKIDIDDQRIASILRIKAHMFKTDKKETDIVMEALEKPIDSERLCDIASNVKRVILITSDHTRPVPSKVTLPYLLGEIKKKNPDVEVKILIATGCHRATSKDEMIKKFGKDIVNNYEVINHNCTDEGVFKGILPSGGRKSILPGIASQKTVLANHCAEFIASPYAKTGNLRNNPIHKDMINETKPDQWQAQILARILSKCKIIMVTERSQHKVVESMFISYAETICEALDLVEKMVGKDTTITVIPDGVGVIVYDK